MDDGPITVRSIRNTIRSKDFRHANEGELHAGISDTLARLGLPVRHEVTLDRGNRIDLTTDLPRPGRDPIVLGIEVKIAGAAADVRRQVQRYAGFRTLGALILVTTVYRHMVDLMPHTSRNDGPTDAGAGLTLGSMPFDIALINRGLL